MSFDWRSFATGFLERTQEIRTEREEEAKKFEEEQRAAAERSAATISRRRAIADQVTGYANYLRNNGATDEQIQAAIASGPEAIRSFTTAVEAAVQRNGGRPLGAEDVATIINMPEGFTGVDMTMQEFINRTYGLSPAVTPEAQPAEEPSFLGRTLFGAGAMDRAQARLRETPYMEGMTIEDINRAALQGEYQSLIPGTFATFAGDSFYDVTERGAEFLRDFNSTLNDIETSPRYNSTAIMERGIAQSDIEAERDRMRIDSVDALVRGYATADNDPEGFMNAHEEQLRSRLGDAYVDALKEDLGLVQPEPESTGGTNGGDTGGDTIITTTLPPAGDDTEQPPAGTEQPEPTETQGATQEDLLPVDDVTVALLNSHGNDIFAFLEENNPQTEEELFNLLTQWGQENNIVMPFDKGPLIQVFRDMVLQQGQ